MQIIELSTAKKRLRQSIKKPAMDVCDTLFEELRVFMEGLKETKDTEAAEYIRQAALTVLNAKRELTK